MEKTFANGAGSTCGHVEPFNIARITKIAEGWSHTVFTPALEATTSTRTFGKLPSVNCYLARENLVISMIHMPWLLLRQVQKLGLLAMYHVKYLRFAARFTICSFSGVRCWYSDCLDVMTTYSFAENFHKLASNCKIHEGFLPRKFLAIRSLLLEYAQK